MDYKAVIEGQIEKLQKENTACTMEACEVARTINNLVAYAVTLENN